VPPVKLSRTAASAAAAKRGVVLPSRLVEKKILWLRGERCLLDRELAELYQVKPIALRQAVRRNPTRFPADFLLRLTRQETAALVSQSVIPSVRSLGSHLPMAFTEQGVAMLSSVLRSTRAVQVNVEIMRAFVRVRELLMGDADLARKLDRLEQKFDGQFKTVSRQFVSLARLASPRSETGSPGGRQGSTPSSRSTFPRSSPASTTTTEASSRRMDSLRIAGPAAFRPR